MEKKGMLEQKNSKIYVQHAVMEKQIMTDMRHRNIVQVCFGLCSFCWRVRCAPMLLEALYNILLRDTICQLHYAFQTSSKLYMVIDLCPGGTL
jgi:serine/threonine protein kinase